MDKIIDLFQEKLDAMRNEVIKKFDQVPTWQLDSILPKEYKNKSLDEKKTFCIENYIKNNPLFVLVLKDYQAIKDRNQSVAISELQSINVDPRFLESLGLDQSQIDDYYVFVNHIKSELSEL